MISSKIWLAVATNFTDEKFFKKRLSWIGARRFASLLYQRGVQTEGSYRNFLELVDQLHDPYDRRYGAGYGAHSLSDWELRTDFWSMAITMQMVWPRHRLSKLGQLGLGVRFAANRFTDGYGLIAVFTKYFIENQASRSVVRWIMGSGPLKLSTGPVSGCGCHRDGSPLHAWILPDAYAIVHPSIAERIIPFSIYSWLWNWLLSWQLPRWAVQMDLVAIPAHLPGQVSLTENRILVKYGLSVLKNTQQ